jgi:hypothetical protein
MTATGFEAQKYLATQLAQWSEAQCPKTRIWTRAPRLRNGCWTSHALATTEAAADGTPKRQGDHAAVLDPMVTVEAYPVFSLRTA